MLAGTPHKEEHVASLTYVYRIDQGDPLNEPDCVHDIHIFATDERATGLGMLFGNMRIKGVE